MIGNSWTLVLGPMNSDERCKACGSTSGETGTAYAQSSVHDIYISDMPLCHRSKVVQDVLNGIRVTTPDWSENSPDLNTIEN